MLWIAGIGGASPKQRDCQMYRDSGRSTNCKIEEWRHWDLLSEPTPVICKLLILCNGIHVKQGKKAGSGHNLGTLAY
jgi:hypothetical protein